VKENKASFKKRVAQFSFFKSEISLFI